MSKTIKKALDILQLIAEDPDIPLSSGTIAKQLNLNPSTCVFILNTLVENGFVDREAPRKGYTLGPMAYFLGRKGPYRKDIVNKAAPLLETLSHTINETVVLATMHNKKRIVLCSFEGDQEVRIVPGRLLDEILHSTATGLTLLANLPEAEQKAYFKKHNLPTTDWPEADTQEKLNALLLRFRKEKMAIKSVTQSVQIGFPIFENDHVVAAIGIPVPKFRFEGETKEKIISEAKHTAENISNVLSKSIVTAT